MTVLIGILIKSEFTESQYEKDCLVYEENGKFGIIDLDGKKITKAKYDSIQGLQDKAGELLVEKGNKYGVITTKGNKVINTDYYNIIGDGYYNSKKSGYIITEKTTSGYRVGYINYKKKKVLDTIYNEISRINDIENSEDTYLIVKKSGRYGVIKNNKIIISEEYQDISYDTDIGVFLIQKNNKYGIFNFSGQQIINFDYDDIHFMGLYTFAQKGDEEDVYDENLQLVKNPKYFVISKENNGEYYIVVNQDYMYGVLDNNKENLIDCKYISIKYMSSNYFIATDENQKIGIIDNKENVKIEFKYDILEQYDNYIMMSSEEETIYINFNCEKIDNPQETKIN